MTDTKLIEYASRFLSSKPRDLHSTVAEQAARFATQLRAGCHQDLLRLLVHSIEDTPDDVSGKEALRIFGCSINEGSDISLWGMPDCACKKPDCVYCSTGMATTRGFWEIGAKDGETSESAAEVAGVSAGVD